MFLLYNIGLFIVALAVMPYYLFKMLWGGKYRRSWGAKLGILPRETGSDHSGSPRIWIHAVSVGEVTAAQPVVTALRARFPTAALFVSTGTEKGQEMARRFIPEATTYLYFPLDIPPVINKVLNIVDPHVFVTTETELWPNFLRICDRRGIKMVIINGRLSPRSFPLYERTSFFWRGVINRFAAVGVISEAHARRFAALGLKEEKIFILGNAKYDGLAARASDYHREEMARLLQIHPSDLVWVNGSTHEGEEEIIFKIFRKLKTIYPNLRLIVAPRHVERAGRVLALAGEHGFGQGLTLSAFLKGNTGPRPEVIVVDRIGYLFKLYGLATVIFCGGSLVPRGGQNILEAAAWGKVVFYGPHMDDFSEEAEALAQTGAGIMVKDGEELLKGILQVLADGERFREKERQAQAMVQSNMGVAGRYAELIEGVLTGKIGGSPL